MTIGDAYTASTKALGEDSETRLEELNDAFRKGLEHTHPQPCEDSLERIRKTLGPKLDGLPRLPCGCIDIPVARLQDHELISRKQVDALLDVEWFDSPWRKFCVCAKRLFVNIGTLFGRPPRL